MRKVIYSMIVSLDGFIESASGDIGWSTPDEKLHKHFNDLESTIDIHLYGRRLYENRAAYWPTADENPSVPTHEIEYARIWKNQPKIVFSKTLDLEWRNLKHCQVTGQSSRLKLFSSRLRPVMAGASISRKRASMIRMFVSMSFLRKWKRINKADVLELISPHRLARAGFLLMRHDLL